MSSSFREAELLTSIASLYHPLSLKSGSLELPHSSDPINIEVITTPEPSIEIKRSSSNSSIVNTTQPTSSSLRTRHAPTPPSNDLQITIDNATYTVRTERKSIKLEDHVSIESNILPPLINLQKNPSQSNTMTDKFLRTHPRFKQISHLLKRLQSLMNFASPKIETLITMLHMPPKILNNSLSGKINVFISSNSKFQTYSA